MDIDLYRKYNQKYKAEQKQIEEKLLRAGKKVSNLDKCVELAMDFAANLRQNWLFADYLTKQKIQLLLFPEGISYNKKTDTCRTFRINSVFAYIAHFKQVITNKKRGIPEFNLDYASFAGLVAGSRIELPTLGL
jgi:site-specific DNA recombinase